MSSSRWRIVVRVPYQVSLFSSTASSLAPDITLTLPGCYSNCFHTPTASAFCNDRATRNTRGIQSLLAPPPPHPLSLFLLPCLAFARRLLVILEPRTCLTSDTTTVRETQIRERATHNTTLKRQPSNHAHHATTPSNATPRPGGLGF